MADILLTVRSNKPGASEVTLINGQLTTGYRYLDSDLGNVTWDKTYSGMRGTQGARLVGATAQNRLSVWTLEAVGTDQDDLQEKLSVLHGLDEELRRFGGTATWRPQGSSFRQHLEILDSGLSYVGFDRLFHHNDRLKVTLGLVSPPYFEYDDFDIFELWASDSIAAGDYTFDLGAAAEIAVVGGQLTAVSNLTIEKRLIHTGRGFTYGDTQATLKFVPGATITSFKAGVVLKRVDALNYIEVYVDDNGTNSRLRLDKVVAGTQTNLSTTNLAARVVNGTSYWVRGRIEDNTVYLEHFLTAPTPMATPTTSASYILTTGEAATFGYATQGSAGFTWIPQHASAVVDDFSVEPYTRRNLTLPDDFPLNGKIPGDAPALVEAYITPSGGAAAPIWAALGWIERPAIYNYVWDGDFENGFLGASHWSVAAVTNISGAATSKTRVTTAAKYGTTSLEIVAPATADTGASFRIFRTFRKGVTYTAEAWIQSAAGTTNTYIRLGNGAANDKASSGNTALSTAWQRITTTWTPSADRADAHVAINIAAATATTYRIDGVMVYEGTVAPTSAGQSEGRGGFPPFGLIDGGNVQGSWPTSGAYFVIDPALLVPDDYTLSEVAIEIWLRLSNLNASPRTLLIFAAPLSSTVGLPNAYTEEFGSVGKPLVVPSSGTAQRLVRAGTIRLPTNAGRYALSFGEGAASPPTIVDVMLVPSRSRALSPSGKANDGNYPKFVAATSELTKHIRVDLSATLIEPGSSEVATRGLGGSLIETSGNNLSAVVKLSSLVPDDPTSNTSTEQLNHSATVHLALTPRGRLGRPS
jgi:hypothetical protein